MGEKQKGLSESERLVRSVVSLDEFDRLTSAEKRTVLANLAKRTLFSGRPEVVRVEKALGVLLEQTVVFDRKKQTFSVPFDESYSIDHANGDFLGECGVSLVRDDKTGSEGMQIWLFDKSDIRTKSAFVASPEVTDGEVKLGGVAMGVAKAESGVTYELDTETLRLEFKIQDAKFVDGEVDKFKVFLVARSKR